MRRRILFITNVLFIYSVIGGVSIDNTDKNSGNRDFVQSYGIDRKDTGFSINSNLNVADNSIVDSI